METPLIHQYHYATEQVQIARMVWFELHDLPTRCRGTATAEELEAASEQHDFWRAEMKSLRTELVAQGILEPRRI